MPLVTVDRPDTGIVRVLINRPDKRNAIDFETRKELIAALQDTQRDDSCRAVVFGGVDHVFSAGADLPTMVGVTRQQARERMQHVAVACRLIASFRVPFVSAAEGFCVGAAVGLALLGDEIIVGQKTRFLFPFLKLGLVPDWAVLRTLPPRVGLTQARRILTSGEAVKGEEAARIGLADQLVDDAQVMDTAVERAIALSRLAPGAFTAMKQRLLNPSATLDEELGREENDQAILMSSTHFKEGYTAFVEKRAPNFWRDADND